MKVLFLCFIILLSSEARVKDSSGQSRLETQNQLETVEGTDNSEEAQSFTEEVEDFTEEAEGFTEEAESFDDFSEEFSQEEEKFDPLEPYNRWMTDANDKVYKNILKPTTNGYNYVFPKPVRQSVNKFFNNLYYPVSFANNLLQVKLKYAGEESVRFMINSTVGLFGFFDPATSWLEIDPHVEDFGQTLGHYGVGSGFPIVLPFFGQRNLRDLGGTMVDAFADPIYHVDDRFYNTVEPYWASVMIVGYDDFNEYSLTPDAYEKLTQDAIDLYPLLQNSYEQYRDAQIAE